MITVRRLPCQTLRAMTAAGLILLAADRSALGDPSPPQAPPWQQEIDAARLLEGSLALTLAKDAADQESRGHQLDELFARLARKYPDEAAVQKAAGDYFTRAGQNAKALPYWERAARLNPRDADTADRFGGELLRVGQTRDAYAQFKRAVDAQPGSASYQFDLANVMYLFRQDLVSPPVDGLANEQDALAEALAHFRRAAQLAPEDLRLAQAYAETFYILAKPNWAQALLAWEAVLALSGEKGDFANSHLARISLRLGRPDDAAGYLARMRDPAFSGMKTQLQKQADRQRAALPHR